MILGLGMILPGGGVDWSHAVASRCLPLVQGTWSRRSIGAVDEGHERSADAAILSSLLWAVTGVAILLAVVEGYDTYGDVSRTETSNILLGLEVLQKSLTWIVLGALAFALSLMVLRWKRNFSGRSILVIAFGVVMWTMATAALQVAIQIANGSGYEYDVSTIVQDWGNTILSLFIFWAVRTGVRSWESKQDTGRYWGV